MLQDQIQNIGVGGTAIWKTFPSNMNEMGQMIELNQRIDLLIDERRRVVEAGMQQKTKNKLFIEDLKNKNTELECRIKDFAWNEVSGDGSGNSGKVEKATEKDLTLWRRKLDDLKSKTSKKRQQL